MPPPRVTVGSFDTRYDIWCLVVGSFSATQQLYCALYDFLEQLRAHRVFASCSPVVVVVDQHFLRKKCESRRSGHCELLSVVAPSPGLEARRRVNSPIWALSNDRPPLAYMQRCVSSSNFNFHKKKKKIAASWSAVFPLSSKNESLCERFLLSSSVVPEPRCLSHLVQTTPRFHQRLLRRCSFSFSSPPHRQ